MLYILFGNKDDEVFFGLSLSPAIVVACGPEFSADIVAAVCVFVIILIPLLLLCIVDDENGEDEPEQAVASEVACSLLGVNNPLALPPPLLATSRLIPPPPPPEPASPVVDADGRGVVEAGGVAILPRGSELFRLRSLVPFDKCCLFVIKSVVVVVSSLVELLFACMLGE